MKSILEQKELDKKDKNLVFSLTPRVTKDKKVFTVVDLMETDMFFRNYCAFRKFEPGQPLVSEFESLIKSNCYSYNYIQLAKQVINPKYLFKALRKSFGADGLKSYTSDRMNPEERELYHKFSRAIFYEPIQDLNHKLREVSEEELMQKLMNNAHVLCYMENVVSNFRKQCERASSKLKDLNVSLYQKNTYINFPAWLPYRKYVLMMELYTKFIESYACQNVKPVEGLPVFETLSITAGRRVAFKLARTEEFKKLLSVKKMLNGDFSQWESHKVQEQFRRICLK